MKQDISSAPSRILMLVLGFVVWSIAFVALYAINAIGCAFDWPHLVQRGILVGLFVAHAIALVLLVRWSKNRWAASRDTGSTPTMLLEYGGLGLMVAALASTVFVLAPSLFVTMCY